MGAVLCTRRVSRHVEGKCVGRTGSREILWQLLDTMSNDFTNE